MREYLSNLMKMLPEAVAMPLRTSQMFLFNIFHQINKIHPYCILKSAGLYLKDSSMSFKMKV